MGVLSSLPLLDLRFRGVLSRGPNRPKKVSGPEKRSLVERSRRSPSSSVVTIFPKGLAGASSSSPLVLKGVFSWPLPSASVDLGRAELAPLESWTGLVVAPSGVFRVFPVDREAVSRLAISGCSRLRLAFSGTLDRDRARRLLPGLRFLLIGLWFSTRRRLEPGSSRSCLDSRTLLRFGVLDRVRRSLLGVDSFLWRFSLSGLFARWPAASSLLLLSEGCCP